MIVWSGKGFLGIVIFIISMFLFIAILPEEQHDYAFVISFFISAVFSWFFGDKWNNQNPKTLIDEKTGQKFHLKTSHTLFWIKMQYWGIIFSFFGIVILAQNTILGSVISSLIIAGIIVFISFSRKKSKKQSVINSNFSDRINKTQTKNKEKRTNLNQRPEEKGKQMVGNSNKSDFNILKDNSISAFIKNNSGFAGVNFYSELFDEDINEYIELTDKLKGMTNSKFDYDLIDIANNTLTLKNSSGFSFLEFSEKKELGLRGNNESKQLQYFKLLNDSLKNTDERFFLYYDHLEPDTHWVGFMDRELIYELHNFIKNSDINKMKSFTNNEVRVLGIGIADKDYNCYNEIVIHP